MQKLLRMDGCATAPFVSAEIAIWRAHAVGLLRRVAAAITRWAIRNGTRRALAELNRHQLLDIGKTAEEARGSPQSRFGKPSHTTGKQSRQSLLKDADPAGALGLAPEKLPH